MASILELRHPCSRQSFSVVLAIAAIILVLTGASRASAQSQERMWFPAVENVANELIRRINAETVRIDISIWYLTEHSVTLAIANRFAAGVPVRLVGDRGSIFEIDPNTKAEFYYLANAGVPIRLRVNPTWFPEIDHMKMVIFAGQNVVEFGSANWDTFSIIPFSSTNYNDETALFTDDPALVGAFKTRFDRLWNDTTPEPESIYGGPPYLRNWMDACVNEPRGCDFLSVYPTPAQMVINTARLEPDNPTPAGLIWGQGPDFNSRLVTEINNENTSILFANYRLTVDDVTNALLNKQRSGVPVQLIIEPNEYLNRAWPEFWLTHANYDKLWAAGVQIKQRNHQGNMHMKTLITSTFATNASSNIAAAWQRDNDYFISAAGKPAVYTAVKNRVVTMWNDPAGFVPFQPGPPDAATLSSPGSGASQVPTNASLVWNIAAFATDYDVFMGLSQSSLTRVANVKAQMVNNPPSQYSWTPPGPLCTGTTYYWSILSRTNATPVNSSLSAQSSLQAFTTAGPNQGCSGMPGGSGNASGDFDGDGHPDLIWQSDASRQVTVWYMGAAGSNALVRANWIDPAGEPGWKIVAVADFNRDGKPDLVWQNDTTRQVTVWYMGGAGGATLVGANWIDPAGQPGWKVVAAADFNGDGQPDLVWQNDTTRQVTVWYMGGAGGATLVGTNWIDPAGQPGWKIVAAADFNRDGKPDLVWQSDASRQVVVWYMGGAAGATPAGSNWIDQAGEPGWAVVAAADFNGDGQPDLVWQNDTTRQVTVWYMGGAAGATLVGAAWIDQTGEPGWKVVGL